jgi:hypothetical protein
MLQSILPGGPTTAQIGNPAHLTRADGVSIQSVRATNRFCRKSLVSDPSNLWSVPEAGMSGFASTQVAPDGTTSATLWTDSGTGLMVIASRNINVGLVPVTLSCYAKYVSSQCVNLLDGNSGAGPTFDIQNGVILNTPGGATASMVNAGNGWWRLIYSFTSSLAANTFYVVNNAVAANNTPTYTSTGKQTLVWGAKFETGSSATPYVSPMLINLAPSVIAVEPEGMSIQGFSTNSLLWSQDFTNAAWTKNSSTVTAAYGIAPDGTLTAQRLVFTGTIGNIHQSATITTPGGVCASLWMRTTTGTTSALKLSLKNASAGFGVINTVTPTLTTSWQLVQVSGPMTSGQSTDFDITNSAAADVQIWGAQLEAVTYSASPATSYIPTTTAAASRSPDYIASNNPGGYVFGENGRMRAVITPNWSGSGQGSAMLGTSSLSAVYQPGDAFWATFVGSSYFRIPGSTFVAGAPSRISVKWTAKSVTLANETNGQSQSGSFASHVGQGDITLAIGQNYSGAPQDSVWLHSVEVYRR